MEYIYAALLLHNTEKEVTEDAITAVLQAAGVEVDAARVKALVASLEGIDIQEAIEKSAFAAAPTASAIPAAAEESAASVEETVEEAAKEEDKEAEEESGMEGLGALFG